MCTKYALIKGYGGYVRNIYDVTIVDDVVFCKLDSAEHHYNKYQLNIGVMYLKIPKSSYWSKIINDYVNYNGNTVYLPYKDGYYYYEKVPFFMKNSNMYVNLVKEGFLTEHPKNNILSTTFVIKR